MRTLIIAGAIALALAGCSDPQANLRESIKNADAVLTCDNGAVVGKDRVTGKLVFVRTTDAGFFGADSLRGYLAPGVTPEQFCGGLA